MQILLFLASAAGGGLAASLLFEMIRVLVPQPIVPPSEGWPALRIWLVWAPRGARITVLTLSVLLVLVAAAAYAGVRSEPVGPALANALDTALAAGFASQVAHLPKLANRAPEGPQDGAGRANRSQPPKETPHV